MYGLLPYLFGEASALARPRLLLFLRRLLDVQETTAHSDGGARFYIISQLLTEVPLPLSTLNPPPLNPEP